MASPQVVSTIKSLPSYDGNLYDDEVLVDPFPTYRHLRELGPLVWLSAHDVVAITRYDQARAALAQPHVFCSGQGVGLAPLLNMTAAGNSILMTDGQKHQLLRSRLMARLRARALRPLTEHVCAAAEQLVDDLVARGSFDAVEDLAVALTMAIVPDLIGWPQDGRADLLGWSAATFDILGPPNARFEAAVPRFAAMGEFARRTVDAGNVLPGSIVDDLLSAASRGEVPRDECPVALVDYLAPSLDTTISGISSAIALFAAHPDQWDIVRSDPSTMAPAAFNEVLRLHSPVTSFTRVVQADVEFGATLLPAGTRVLVLFASANRDDAKYRDPDRFDVRRNPVDMLGFGWGVHACAGQGLARLEAHSIIEALARKVSRFTTASARPELNNTIHALAELRVSVEADTRCNEA